MEGQTPLMAEIRISNRTDLARAVFAALDGGCPDGPNRFGRTFPCGQCLSTKLWRALGGDDV